MLTQVETPAAAQKASAKPEDCNCTHAPDGSPLDTGISEIRPVIERYQVELRDVVPPYIRINSSASTRNSYGCWTLSISTRSANPARWTTY
jgi:hypothetical protein